METQGMAMTVAEGAGDGGKLTGEQRALLGQWTTQCDSLFTEADKMAVRLICYAQMCLK